MVIKLTFPIEMSMIGHGSAYGVLGLGEVQNQNQTKSLIPKPRQSRNSKTEHEKALEICRSFPSFNQIIASIQRNAMEMYLPFIV